MNRHEIIDAPTVRRDPRSGHEFREVLVAAWQRPDKRRTGNTITRRINGTRLQADLFSRLKVFYQPVGNRIKEYDTRLGPAWHDLTTRTMVLISEAAIEPDAVAAQRNWEREQFSRDMAAEIGGCVARFMDRAETKSYVGDRRHTTLNLQVGANADDTRLQGTLSFSNSDGSPLIGKSGGYTRAISARFTGATGIGGATIDSATLILTGESSQSGTPLLQVRFEKSETPAAPTDITTFLAKARTTAKVDWDDAVMGANVEDSPPDMAAVLQEVVDLYDPGELQVFVEDDGSVSESCEIYAHDLDSAKAPKLDVDHTSIVPPTVTSVTPDSGTTAGGTTVVIVGTGFAAGASVDFDEDAATSVSVDDPETITCDTPAHVAGAVDVTVTNTDTGEDTLSEGYEYTEPVSAGSSQLIGRHYRRTW